jgi:short-subunit dehydrogenase
MTQKILITGASSGIGKALAFEMANRGYAIGLTARRKDELEKIRDEIKKENPNTAVAVRKLDVTDYDDVSIAVKSITEELSGLDIAFVNAGIGLGEEVGKGQFEKSRKTIETNLTGAMATIDAAVNYFLEAGRGHIVGVASVAAFRGMPRSASYSASKAGLSIYLEALRAETYRKNIDVTVLYPGYIDTPLNSMLKNRPFLISVEKGAAIIARLIEKKVKSSTVPVFPWNIVGRLLKILPTSVISKI